MTAAEAQAHLDKWIAASDALASGLSYRMGDNILTRSDWDQVQKAMEYWDKKVTRLTNGGRMKIRRSIPLG